MHILTSETTGFMDIIKSKFLEDFGAAVGTMTLDRVFVALGIALAISLFIFVVYKKTYSGVMYNRSFNISLILLSMITTLVLLTVTSNLTLSLGMVGALSIVRFRTAVKEALDTAYMFWAISVGIAVGAGYYMLAVGGSLFIGIVMLLVSLVRIKGSSPYLLVIRHDHESAADVKFLLGKLPRHKVKSRVASRDMVEVTLELSLKSENTALIHNFLKIEGVETATLVSYQGDYTA